MNVAGIVAEYNPFHTGHAYQIAQTRAQLGEDCGILAVMSGNWVQQADCAIADKWLRARLALMGGADLVLELPTVWATASAEGFARGAVEILGSTGVVTHLSFGSECGDVQALKQVAKCLDTEQYRAQLKTLVDSGLPFAAARQQAAERVLGEGGTLLSKANNNLGVEYIRALNALKSPIRPMTVERRGSGHNVIAALGGAKPRFLSATQIRWDVLEGRWEDVEPYLVAGGRALLEKNGLGLPAIKRAERAILAKIRTMTARDWACLPDSGGSEGLPRRLERAGRQCRSMEEFFELAKTKRFTHARLRRLVLWAYLGLEAQLRPEHPLYLRVLGFNDRGREILREMGEKSALPVLTKPAHAKKLSPEGQALFELECRCTDLYDLCFETVPVPGREWRMDPVRLVGEEHG